MYGLNLCISWCICQTKIKQILRRQCNLGFYHYFWKPTACRRLQNKFSIEARKIFQNLVVLSEGISSGFFEEFWRVLKSFEEVVGRQLISLQKFSNHGKCENCQNWDMEKTKTCLSEIWNNPTFIWSTTMSPLKLSLEWCW